MEIKIKTELISLEIKDEPTITSDGYTKRSLPEVTIALVSAIDEAIRLHNEAAKSDTH